MRISDWSSDVCSSDLISLDEISDVLANDDDSFVWVGVYEPEDAVLDKLQEEFDLHDLAIEDARNAHQRPKLEAYGDSLFIVVNTAQVIDERIRSEEHTSELQSLMRISYAVFCLKKKKHAII